MVVVMCCAKKRKKEAFDWGEVVGRAYARPWSTFHRGILYPMHHGTRIAVDAPGSTVG
jgi:hypothetical protein